MALPPPKLSTAPVYTTIDFSDLFETLQAEADVREKIRDAVRVVEKDERACQAILNRVHTVDTAATPALLATLDPLLPSLAASLAALAVLIPPASFYRYSDMFSRTLQAASFIVVFRYFLIREDAPSKEDVSNALGISDTWRDHFFLPIEDYLHSLISLLNELSRLAVNRVTLGDYGAPARYARFAKELSSAFGLLNLKNDTLRKRFDGIKYDVKKLEEVVYDLSLRGLLTSSGDTAGRPLLDETAEKQGPTKRPKTEA